MSSSPRRRLVLFLPMLLGLVVFAIGLVDKVRHDRVGELLDSLRGGGFGQVGLLIVIALLPLLFVGGAAARWWGRRHERDFERKYGRRASVAPAPAPDDDKRG